MPERAEPPIEIVHFADPMCWWSWGLEPVLQRLKEVYGDNVKVTYRMGGTFRDLKEWMTEYEVDETSTPKWIQESAEMTGMPVATDYLWRSKVTSTYPACLAFKAAQLQSPEKADRYFRRMMEAFQVEGRPATQEEYARLAAEVGLDGERLRKDVRTAAVQKAFEEDMHAMHASQANFLSLVVRNRAGKAVAKGQTFTAAPFEEIVDRLAPVATDAGPFWRWGEKHVDKMPLELVRISHVTPTEYAGKTDLEPVITKAVQAMYTEVATRPDKEYHFPLGMAALPYLGYPEEDLRKLPPTAVESFAGVGYPFAANAIRSGDTW